MLMSTIGVRDLAKHTSAIINEIEQTREPALITRRGHPVAYILAVDSDEFENFVLAHAPEFVEVSLPPMPNSPQARRSRSRTYAGISKQTNL
jgi:antitoxin (DNA-binding transcriptional repressor) of toxin-antitoxin stability system